MYFILRGKVKLFLPQKDVATHYPDNKLSTLPNINLNNIKTTIDESDDDVFLTQKTNKKNDTKEDQKKLSNVTKITIKKNEKIKELELFTQNVTSRETSEKLQSAKWRESPLFKNTTNVIQEVSKGRLDHLKKQV